MILGLDPSFRATGWVIADDSGLVLNAGCISTTPKKGVRPQHDDLRRIRILRDGLKHLGRSYPITQCSSELLGGSQSSRAARSLGIASALVEASFPWCDIVYVEPRAVKLAMTGNPNASKRMMVNVARRYQSLGQLMDGKTVVACEAIADALGVLVASELVQVRG